MPAPAPVSAPALTHDTGLKPTDSGGSRTSSPENGMPATSLERLPSALKNMFVGNTSPKSSPENAPKWYNNTPKDDPNDPAKVIAQMKNDYNKQVKHQQKQEETLIKVSEAPPSPWYEDDEEDMKDLLAKRPSILREVDMNQDRRLTPEENAAVIKMYGGVMFPGGGLETTPRNLLFKVIIIIIIINIIIIMIIVIHVQVRPGCRPESESGPGRDNGYESQQMSQRTDSTSSNSTLSSEPSLYY